MNYLADNAYRGSNLNNFISQKPQVSLLDGLFPKQLPCVRSEPPLPVDTESDPASNIHSNVRTGF